MSGFSIKLAKSMNTIFSHAARMPGYLIPPELKTSYNINVMKIYANVQGRIAAHMINSEPELCRKCAMDALLKGNSDSSDQRKYPSKEHKKLMDSYRSTFRKTVIKKVALPNQQP